VYESGDRTELGWQQYRANKKDGLGEFVEAAMREPRVWAVAGGRFTVGENRSVEPDITYAAAEAVQVCLAEMERLGVPSPEDLRSRGSDR